MKTQHIELLEYNIIVSDEEVKKGDYCYNTYDKIYQLNDEHGVKTANDYIKSKDVFKIIASTNPEHNLPSINYNGFEEEFGIVDVEKLADNTCDNETLSWENDYNKEKYIEGFKLAESLNNKKFSLEDVRKIAQAAFTIKSNNETLIEDFEKWFSNRIKSLQQPKITDIEVKMENNQCDGCNSNIPLTEFNIHRKDKELGIACSKDRYNVPKITNNQITITKIL